MSDEIAVSTPTLVVSNLSAKERKAVARYVIHGNKTRAYKEAGYTAKHADRAASRLFKKPKILNAIEEFFHREEMSAREAVAVLSRQARGNMADFLHIPRNADGEPLRNHDIEVDLWKAEDLEQLGVLKKFKQRRLFRTQKDGTTEEETITDIELYDAQSAAEKIGRYHGIFKDNLKVDLDLSQLSDEELDALDDAL